jgi:hypothetical protein
MEKKQQLLMRLDEIGGSLARKGHALALIGLGSVGLELDRLDEHSDLDFFAIVEPGYKRRFIENLDWLSVIRPIAYAFPNTVDGYKLLFEDGIFCEFAVFEPDELRTIPFAPGRVIWKQPQVAETIGLPATVPQRPAPGGTPWVVGEALTNLYVGMERYRRGEKLSAMRFIQHYAVDRVLELAARVEPEQPAQADPFSNERRFEQRFPQLAGRLAHFAAGYERSPEAALAILAFLEAHFEVNSRMAQEIRHLCGG